jgi:hypothetical protein
MDFVVHLAPLKLSLHQQQYRRYYDPDLYPLVRLLLPQVSAASERQLGYRFPFSTEILGLT